MLGPPKPRRLDQPIAVSLEELIPRDNFYRHLEAKLDLSFVRDWTRELYAERGRPSIDAVVLFKPQLVMFFEKIRSEHRLMAGVFQRHCTRAHGVSSRYWCGRSRSSELADTP
jgi:transposase